MRIIIKNVEDAFIGPAVQQGLLNVHISGIEPDDLLFQIDIVQVINYYGITELLDTIGEEQIRLHLLASTERSA
ncbi:hypothetical protein [Pedobacter nanyangensis]|uniref:hypothetical protein n=1 Tax=Pedobacter nanyangensis TaxID=1562389 RepID=UPI000DE4F243|nr:hypothetical protein [Pedobacter nanyangensis]